MKCNAEISLVECNSAYTKFKVKLKLKVPVSLTDDRKKQKRKLISCPITSYITVVEGVPRVDIITEVDNQAEDHRLRVLFPSGIRADYSYAEGHFDVVKRPIAVPDSKLYVGMNAEQLPTYPQRSFVDVNDKKRGITIANSGLLEFEVKDDHKRTVALTLLRSVKYLTSREILTRRGKLGHNIPVPQAQCKGKHIFRYSIIPHSGTWQQSLSYRQSYQHNTPMRAVKTGKHKGVLPDELSFFNLKPDNLVLSAIKKAEKSNSVIMRFFNISNKSVNASIQSYKKIQKAQRVNLEEKIEGVINHAGYKVVNKVNKHEIVTMSLFHAPKL